MEKAAAIYIGKYDESDLLNQVNLAAGLAVDYLLEAQNQDGYWYDYRLPVGVSDEWVTGFIGRSLIDWLPNHKALVKAAEVLLAQRAYENGWGYNKQTGADADSTANVVLFLRSLDILIPARDQEFLLSHRQPDGGFSTYLDNKGWSVSHPDVTPMVFLALSDSAQRLCLESVASYINQQCVDHYLWPAYWWRNCFYSSFHNYRLVSQYFDTGSALSPTLFEQTVKIQAQAPYRIDSSFDLAWLCGLYWLQVQKEPHNEKIKTIALALTQELIDLQMNDGSWLGDESLRVTDPETRHLNLSIIPAGKYYADQHNTLSTASVLQVFTLAKSLLDVYESVMRNSKQGEFLIFYRDTCGKCRLLSIVAIILSFGILKRVAISSDEAQTLYERFPESRGKLLLVLNDRYFMGSQVPKYFPATLFYWIAYRWATISP